MTRMTTRFDLDSALEDSFNITYRSLIHGFLFVSITFQFIDSSYLISYRSGYRLQYNKSYKIHKVQFDLDHELKIKFNITYGSLIYDFLFVSNTLIPNAYLEHYKSFYQRFYMHGQSAFKQVRSLASSSYNIV